VLGQVRARNGAGPPMTRRRALPYDTFDKVIGLVAVVMVAAAGWWAVWMVIEIVQSWRIK